MVVKLKTRMAGPDGNYPAGSVITVTEDQGRELTDGGYAADVSPEPKKRKTK